MKKILLSLLLILSISLSPSSAQETITRVVENSNLQGIAANGMFNIELRYGLTPSAEITIPLRHYSRLKYSVDKHGILQVRMGEIKEPDYSEVFNITITLPHLSRIKVSDNVLVNCYGEFLCGELVLHLSGNSRLNNLNIRGTRVISYLKGGASISNASLITTHQNAMDLRDRSSIHTRELTCSSMEMYTSDRSQVMSDSTHIAGLSIMSVRDNSKVELIGFAPYVNIRINGSSSVDLLNCLVEDIQVIGRGMSTVSCEFTEVAMVNLSVLSEFRYKGTGRCEGNRNMIKL